MPQPSHPTPDGTHYPSNHVLALLDTQEVGVETEAALVVAGFAKDDIVLFNGEEGWQEIQSRQTLRSRFGHWLDRLSEDGVLGREVYMEGLRAGQTLLMVYAPDDASVERARAVLSAHGAQKMIALRRFTIEPL
jgi:hypothetical protein